ncbi:hypothetical protein H4R21_004655, partial [Coemansia helicoidea]
MRLAICAFVATHYWGAQDDPHFAAALDGCQALLAGRVSHLLPSPATQAGRGPWPEPAPRRKPAPGGDGDAAAAGEDDLDNVRLRCVLPAIVAAMAALADSLDPGLMVQSPTVVRQALWLTRIVCREFPDIAAVTMRTMSSIDTRALTAADAAGLLRLCGAYLTDTALDARQKPPVGVDTKSMRRAICDVEDIVARLEPPSAEACCSQPAEPAPAAQPEPEALSKWLDALPACLGSAAVAKLTRDEYFRDHPELRPCQMVPAGRIFAQFALDRYVAGWWTCKELYSCAEAPGLADRGTDFWIVDRSGPRGAGRQSPPTVEQAFESPVSESGSDRTRAMQTLPPVVVAPLPRAARASSSGSAGSTHHPRTRPPSPFPMYADLHPDPDDGQRLPAVTGPQTSLSGAPGVLYRNHAPYYPAFTVLADGCTVWNASWRFESARMRTGVDGRLGGVHRFHVGLLTSGLLQIGWCSNRCGFYPESGEGVGDDYESVAYDGYRQRKWYGAADDKPYGERWQAGDIVTAELDLDNGRVVFYRNGRSQGLAFGPSERGDMEGGESGFQGLSRDRTWYPAFSFSSDQGLVFLGSDDGDQLRHPGIALPPCDGGCDGPVESIAAQILKRQGERAGDADGPSAGDPVAAAPAAAPERVPSLARLGVATALRIRFEFQDLDAFPCFALTLPADQGRITVGPVTDPANLSTYLQPRWWAVWTADADGCTKAPDVRQAPPSGLQQWFARCAGAGDGTGVRQRALLTDSMASSAWLYFVVLTDGRLCLAV